MERLERRLAEAAAALATLDDLATKKKRSLVERDGAVLRLIYSYEAVWKACQKFLADLENVSAGSPNAAIRAARSLGWPADWASAEAQTFTPTIDPATRESLLAGWQQALRRALA